MGIPLAALAINTQGPSPIDTALKGVQLKSMIGQQQQQAQMHPLELQQAQLALQQQQLQVQDQQAATKAMQQWDGKDLNELPQLMKKNGASFQAVTTAQSHILDMHAKAAQAIKADADAAKTQFDTENEKNQHLIAGLDNVLQMPPEQQAAALEKEKQLAIQNQWLDPQHAQAITYQSPDQLQALKKTLQGQSAFTAEQSKNAETEKAKQDAALAQMKAKQLAGQEKSGGAVGTGLDVQEANAWLKKNPGKDLSDFQEYKAKLVPAFNFNLQASGGGAAAAPTLNKSQQATADAILEGRMTPPSSFALKSPYWQNVMGAVFQKDPQFNEQRAQLRKSFTQDKEIGAINTALGHVGILNDAIDSLKNGDVRVLNSIANRLGLETGSTPMATFKTIVHRVGPELTKAYVGSGGGQDERGTTEADFDPNLAPQTLKANTAITAELLRSKISSKAYQWNQNKSEGMPSFEDRFIMPEARQTLDRLNPQGGKASTTPSTTEHKPGGQATGLREGQTGTGSDGKKYIVKGGVWVTQ
jgi:hypothetical protein